MKIYIRGRSFLYNQIRKMVNAVVMVTYYGLREDFIDHSLWNETNIEIHPCPGEGLILNNITFDWVSIRDVRIQLGTPRTESREVDLKIEEWREKLAYDSMDEVVESITLNRSNTFEHLSPPESPERTSIPVIGNSVIT